MDKLKKEAAALGCHIVLIVATSGADGGFGKIEKARASFTGVAYGY